MKYPKGMSPEAALDHVTDTAKVVCRCRGWASGKGHLPSVLRKDLRREGGCHFVLSRVPGCHRDAAAASASTALLAGFPCTGPACLD